jgi:RNA polymerase sigma factor (sigma-70 family)
MSLSTVSDRFLAARTAEGDQAAFAELARRYRPLLVNAALGPPRGLEIEDLRQEGLLALLATCAVYDPARGPFAALAARNVRRRINKARHAARARKHGVLSDALRDGEEAVHQVVARLRAPESSDPARVAELRDELRERAEARRRPRVDRRQRYSDEQVDHALRLIADGHSIKQAAFVAGASRYQVARWLAHSGLPRPRPRGHTPAEIRMTLALLQAGASQRAAAAAVGTSKSTLQYWLKSAA